jgi:hypothetical protein
MTRSRDIERARAAHYQEPAPSSQEPDDGPDFAALGIEPRYLPALDGTQPYHRAPEAGRAAPISERRVAELVAGALEPPSDEDALGAALATPEGRAVLQDDPCEPGGDPFWHELFGGAPRLDGAL